MKRFLLSLVMILLASVCSAQDIIVKKDGSTIQAKVISVSSTEVTYKRFDNQTGPTYTISVEDLLYINYENGTKDTFASPSYTPGIVTNETATQFSNDKQLLDIYKNRNKKVVTTEMLYKKGKRMRVAGFVVGGTLLVSGLALVIAGAAQDKYDYEYFYAYSNYINHSKYINETRYYCFYIGDAAMGAAAVIGIPLILKGSSLQKKNSPQVHAVSAISHDINFNNGSCLNLGIDVLSSNLSYNKTPGIGIRYNF